MKLRALTIIALAITSLVACGKPDLSRSEALALILESDAISELARQVHTQKNAVDKGLEQGVWRRQNRQLIVGTKAADAIIEVSHDTISLREKTGVAIEVTGIAGVPKAEGIKEVQFGWEYKELPSVVKRFATRGGDGIAVFRLFDDGWRLESVDIQISNEPATLLPEEKNDELADIEAERARRQREHKAKQLAEEQRANLIRESKTPTRVVKSYVFEVPFRHGLRKELKKHEISLTDVYIEGTTSYGKKRKVFLGEILDVSYSRSATGNDYLSVPTAASGNILLQVDRAVVPEEFVQIVKSTIIEWWERFGDVHGNKQLRWLTTN